MADRWRVSVDHTVCIGSGSCVVRQPGVFQLDDGRKSVPVAAEVDGSDDVYEAAEMCPVEAIALARADDDEAVFPPAE